MTRYCEWCDGEIFLTVDERFCSRQCQLASSYHEPMIVTDRSPGVDRYVIFPRKQL